MRWAALALLGLGAGCAAVHPGPQHDGGAACGAAAYGHLWLAPAARAAEIAAPGGVRVIRPGDGVTPDHRPDRLNVEIDPLGRIVGLRCG